mmetsp:Transcript_31726/g.36662  ORF Transcript_31726/g.36662 Transcript_31726/m.36662 type:complete len:212 (-) Transcript_31726:302-937(-)
MWGAKSDELKTCPAMISMPPHRINSRVFQEWWDIKVDNRWRRWGSRNSRWISSASNVEDALFLVLALQYSGIMGSISSFSPPRLPNKVVNNGSRHWIPPKLPITSRRLWVFHVRHPLAKSIVAWSPLNPSNRRAVCFCLVCGVEEGVVEVLVVEEEGSGSRLERGCTTRLGSHAKHTRAKTSSGIPSGWRVVISICPVEATARPAFPSFFL